ncbi:MAG: hypothetical protein AAF502_19560 [Bacteroidota bacterium]
MALLNWGSEKRAGITFSAKAKWKIRKYKKEISLPSISNLEMLEAISSKLKMPQCRFQKAAMPWNLVVRDLTLTKESICFYPELFNTEKDKILLGCHWTLNGGKPQLFPATDDLGQWAFVDLAFGNTRQLKNEYRVINKSIVPSGQLGVMIFLVEMPRNAEKRGQLLAETRRLLEDGDFCKSVVSFPGNLNSGWSEQVRSARMKFVDDLKRHFLNKKLDILPLFEGFFGTSTISDDLKINFDEEYLKFEIELLTTGNREN